MISRNDRIIQPIDTGLTASELQNIGIITLNWGAGELMLGAAIQAAHKAQSSEHFSLIYSMDYNRNMSELKSLFKQNKLNPSSARYINEIEYCSKNFKFHRNMVAHGMTVSLSNCKAIIKGNGEFMPASSINLAVDQSRYFLFIAHWLNQVVIGHTNPPLWPARPITIASKT